MQWPSRLVLGHGGDSEPGCKCGGDYCVCVYGAIAFTVFNTATAFTHITAATLHIFTAVAISVSSAIFVTLPAADTVAAVNVTTSSSSMANVWPRRVAHGAITVCGFRELVSEVGGQHNYSIRTSNWD